MDKKQREARRQQEDIALQRGLMWVAGAVVLEGLLMLVNRFYLNYSASEVEIAYGFHNALKLLRFAAPVLAIAALVWAALRLKQGGKTGLPLILAVAFGAVGICSHVTFTMKETGMSMLFWLVIAWAVLALVFYLYQREFFLAAAGAGMSILGLWFVRYQGTMSLESGLAVAGIALVLAAALWLKQRGGVLPGAAKVQFLPKDACYGVVLASCLAGLAVVAAAVAIGGTTAYYLIYLMLAWLFGLFVYYTVKLM